MKGAHSCQSVVRKGCRNVAVCSKRRVLSKRFCVGASTKWSILSLRRNVSKREQTPRKGLSLLQPFGVQWADFIGVPSKYHQNCRFTCQLAKRTAVRASSAACPPHKAFSQAGRMRKQNSQIGRQAPSVQIAPANLGAAVPDNSSSSAVWVCCVQLCSIQHLR